MCIKPIRIKNNSKYISIGFGKPYYIWVNCGKCEECRRAKQVEWNLRTYYETKDLLSKNENAYIYFDTLTYSNENLPRITDRIEANKNYACFNYKDIRKFYETLRQNLKLKKDRNIRFFITSEYGEIRHRPHYHVMLFVNEDINPIKLSEEVNKAWGKGRTDGRPWKTRNYVLEHNVIREINLDCIRYVAKYVNKSQTFKFIIDKRWEKLEKWYEKSKYNKLQIERIRKQYYRLTTPFHRQSQNYGLSAIENLNIEELIKHPILTYKDDSIRINVKTRIPMYFQRHLFQKQIRYNGKRIWVNNELGIRYKKEQESKILEAIEDRLKDAATNKGIELHNTDELAKYILLERGRTPGKDDYRDHKEDAQYFNYNTKRDLLYLGKKCISINFAGNDTIGYETTQIEPTEIDNLITINPQYEKQIEELITDKDDTKLILLQEHMNEIKKIFFQKTCI